MFITVKFGDNRQELFNPHCRVCILLDYIRQRCDCSKDDVIDLSDQNGVRKDLFLNPTDYANKHLEDRDILILIKIERSPGSMSKTCIPLLNSLQGDKDFLEKLNHKLNPDPNAQNASDKSAKVNPHGTRRASVNFSKKSSQNILGGKKNKARRSQSISAGTGSSLLSRNFKK